MSLSRDELVKLILNNSDIKTAEDIQNTLKDLFGGLLQQMLETEMEQHLGYAKNDMDAIHFKVRKDNSIVSKAAYAVIGVNL